MRTWPNCNTANTSSDQVPTVIRYINPQTRAKQWGYEVVGTATSAEQLRWFKLLLQESTHLSGTPRTSSAKPLNSDFNTLSLLGNKFISQTFTPPPVTPARVTAQILQKLQISPVTVVSDFLKSVLETTKANIKNCYGAGYIRACGMEYVLTVPAIWSDSAKAQMVKAAEGAGFGSHQEDFHFISEHECVAAYTLNAIAPNNLKARLLHHLGHVNRD